MNNSVIHMITNVSYCLIYPTAAKLKDKKEISISFCIIKLSKVTLILKKKKEKMKKKYGTVTLCWYFNHHNLLQLTL